MIEIKRINVNEYSEQLIELSKIWMEEDITNGLVPNELSDLKEPCYAAFDGDKIVVVKEQCVLTIDDLVNEIGEEVLFLGDGVDAYREILDEKLSLTHSFAKEDDNHVKASSFVYLAKAYFDEGKTMSADEFAPDYLMLSQAERELKEKQKND